VIDRAKLPNRFAELYPAVRDYVATRCFGKAVNLENEALRSHLSRLELQEGVAKYLGRKIAELTIERRAIEFDRADFGLSETKPFSWRRNLPPLAAEKTVFNYVATYNDFERRFAQFLDKQAGDVLRFASLGTTEQGESGTQFRVDYLKPSGAIGFYHPDWVVVQTTKAGDVNWIIETKGRVWEGTAAKDDAIKHWCERVSAATGVVWRYMRVNQAHFAPWKWASLAQILDQSTPESLLASAAAARTEVE
jgi:type III restriction enzyme